MKPLAFEQKTDGNGYGVNSLHCLIGGIIASHTGVPVPSDDELLGYIQHHFSRLFIRRT